MYFITLIGRNPDTGRNSRCIGYFNDPPTPRKLNASDTEDGYYQFAVIERYSPGTWMLGKVVEWWHFKEGMWVETTEPEWAKHIGNWAFG